jgi:hypothetical protein
MDIAKHYSYRPKTIVLGVNRGNRAISTVFTNNNGYRIYCAIGKELEISVNILGYHLAKVTVWHVGFTINSISLVIELITIDISPKTIVIDDN